MLEQYNGSIKDITWGVFYVLCDCFDVGIDTGNIIKTNLCP